MPISKYYGGHGSNVMRAMREKYGERAERVFYATANKRKAKPSKKKYATMMPKKDADTYGSW